MFEFNQNNRDLIMNNKIVPIKPLFGRMFNMPVKKKKYVKPLIEVVEFCADDVIVTSLQDAGVMGEVSTDTNPEHFPLP